MAPRDIVTTARPASLDDVHTLLERAVALGGYTASPADWRDEVLYFLLPDRFSDGRETTRPLLTRAADPAPARRPRHGPTSSGASGPSPARAGRAAPSPAFAAGSTTCGASASRALWIGPVFKQRARARHLSRLRHPGLPRRRPALRHARRPRRRWSSDAHARGMRIILDVIVNHTGDNWGYVPPGVPAAPRSTSRPSGLFRSFYGNPAEPATAGWSWRWRDEHQQGVVDGGAAEHDGVFPRELRDAVALHARRHGRARRGDLDDPHAEHKRTDFFALKDLAARRRRARCRALVDCYQYWIALTDCDGFRIDTVKHMALEETRNFCGAIREFADRLGKDNFLLVGEIAGGDASRTSSSTTSPSWAQPQRRARHRRRPPDPRPRREGPATRRGLLRRLRRRQRGFGSHRAFGNRHVSILDDHDHVFGAQAALLGRDPRRLRSRITRSWRRRPSSSSRSAFRASTTAPSRRSPGRREPAVGRSSPSRLGRDTIATCARRCSAPRIRGAAQPDLRRR